LIVTAIDIPMIFQSTYRVESRRLRDVAITVFVLAEEFRRVHRVRLRQSAHDLRQIDERVLVERGVVAPLGWLLVEPLVEAAQPARLGHALEVVLPEHIAHIADLVEATKGKGLVLVDRGSNVLAVVRVLDLLRKKYKYRISLDKYV